MTLQLFPPETELFEGGYDPSLAHQWQTQVGFFTRWESPPWNFVLGQVGFFDQFTVTLNRHAQCLAITDVGEFDQRHPQEVTQSKPPPVKRPRFRP